MSLTQRTRQRIIFHTLSGKIGKVERLLEVPVTYFMKVIKVVFTFDEKIFPDAWRINSQDCKISDDEKRSIVFFHPDQSLELWKNHVSSKSLHLMKILADDIQVSSKLKLDFSLEDEGRNFFFKGIETLQSGGFLLGRS